jgi:hypothetical protein
MWPFAPLRRRLTRGQRQTEAEDEAVFEEQTQTVMEIPELVPAVCKLIARHGR